MRQLRERGEGLFLLSLGVAQAEDVVLAQVKYDGYTNGALSEVRNGIAGWRVADFQIAREPNGQFQLAFGQND